MPRRSDQPPAGPPCGRTAVADVAAMVRLAPPSSLTSFAVSARVLRSIEIEDGDVRALAPNRIATAWPMPLSPPSRWPFSGQLV